MHMQVDPLLSYTLTKDTLLGLYNLFWRTPAEESVGCAPCTCQCVGSGESDCSALERLVAQQLKDQAQSTASAGTSINVSIVVQFSFFLVALVIGVFLGRLVSPRSKPAPAISNGDGTSGPRASGRTGGGIIITGAGA